MSVKISIIIPIYYMEKYLAECLNSVFAQSLKEIEVVYIDDGSTDKTLEILYNYLSLHKNMIIVYQERQGAGIARNKGIEIAQGEYIAFMDSDDFYPNNSVLEKLYFNAVRNNVSMAGGFFITNYEGKIRYDIDNFFEGRESC